MLKRANCFFFGDTMAEKGTAFSHIKTQRVTKRSKDFGLYRSENMGFQSRSNDEGGRDRNLRPQKPVDGSQPARQNWIRIIFHSSSRRSLQNSSGCSTVKWWYENVSGRSYVKIPSVAKWAVACDVGEFVWLKETRRPPPINNRECI